MEWCLSSSVFCSIAAVLLLLCLTWMILRGPFRWHKQMGSWSWRCFLPFFPQSVNVSLHGMGRPQLLAVHLITQADWKHDIAGPAKGPQESTVGQQVTVEESKGTNGQVKRPQLGPQQCHGNSEKDIQVSMHHVVCDNLACAVCKWATSEGQKPVHSKAWNLRFLESQQPPLPTTPYVEHSCPPGVVEREDPRTIPRSSRNSENPSWTPAAAPIPSKTKQPSSYEEPKGKRSWPFAQEVGLNVGACEEDPGREAFPCSVDRGGHKENCDCSSLGKSEMTVLNWTPITSSSSAWSESSDCSWEKRVTSSHQTERDFSSLLSQGTRLPSPQRRNPHGSFQKASSMRKARPPPRSCGSHPSRVNRFPAKDAPLLTDEARSTLERHLALKRVQHEMGLPSLLRKSLRAFLPLAPDHNFQWPPRRDSVVVATRPRVLPFLTVATRKRLEQHVKKTVHLSRWGLPQRVLGALRHLQLDSHSAPDGTSPTGRKEGGGAKCQRTARGSSPDSHPAHRSSPITHPAPRSSPNTQVKLQIHVVKKSFQVGQERFPKVVKNSQKTAAPEERKPPLPKLIPRHRRCPQLRSGPCLLLRKKADCVEMNVKSKRIHFLWGLPTLYTQSLCKMVASAPGLPASLPRTHGTVEFDHEAALFLPTCEQQQLDSHILRKRAQHQWGMPRLVQRSLLHFLPRAPCLAPRWVSMLSIRVKVEMVPGGSTPFVTLETKRQLEEHIRRKIVERRWGLPKRVMESLHVFMPQPPPLAKMSRAREGATIPIQSKRILRRPPTVQATNLPKWRSPECRQSPKQSALKRHVTQKALEIHLELLSSITQPPRARKYDLPKAVQPGSGAQQPRSQELFFVQPAVLSCIELNIIHKDLMQRWGLPTLYQMSLSCLFQEPPHLEASPPPAGRQDPGLNFFSAEVLFIEHGAWEELEWHVRRKQMQHLWGMPSLAQRSLRCLVPAVPHLHHQQRGQVQVTVLPAQLFFLHEATVQQLERNVRRRINFQQWQLPKRVLRSLKMLYPEHRLKSGMLRAPLTLGTKCSKYGAKIVPGVVSADPPKVQILHTLGSEPRGNMEIHLAKKCMEQDLGSPPVVSGSTWQQTPFPARRPLPRLISHGQKVLQARSSLCSSIHAEDLDRIEWTMQCCHLASLWGLGERHVGGRSGPSPRLAAQAVRPQGAVSESREVPTPFLPEKERAALELHVTKKKIQHEWRTSILLQSSLQAFMEEAPKVPAQQKTSVRVRVIQQQELSFLPLESLRGLELHVQKRTLQRTWGLPKRVLWSFGALCPAVADTSCTEQGSRSRTRGAVSSPREPQVRLVLQTKALETMELHLDKKCLEAQLEVLPALVRPSWQSTQTAPRHPLPRAIPPGCRPLQARSTFLPFTQTTEVDQMESVLQWNHLMSFWGLGRSWAEALGSLMPKSPLRPLGAQGTALDFLPMPTAFLPHQEREKLELHIQKRRIQHQWGLPGLVQRSLAGFTSGAPSRTPLQKTMIQVQTRHQQLFFLPTEVCNHLEQHLQSVVRQRRWGLPQKILRFLRPLGLDLGSGICPQKTPTPKLQLDRSCKEMSESLVAEERDPLEPRSGRASSQPRPQLCVTCRSTFLEKIQLTLIQREERQSGISPPVAQLPWQHVPASWGQPLIPPGYHVSQPGSPFLPLTQVQEVGRVESTPLGRHGPPLSELGRNYEESLGGPMPELPFWSPKAQRAAFVFLPRPTPFLPDQERETIELYIQKRRIQHQWGLPGLVRRSLAGFMCGTPSRMPLQKTLFQVQTRHQQLFFLPTEVCNRLEQHLQSVVRQRRWGLPRKILRFLRPLGLDLGLGSLGQKAPSSHLPWLEKSNMEAAVMPGTPSQSPKSGEADIEFSEMEIPFLQAQVREDLERHVRKKKLQHEWGFPILVQKSLMAFLEELPLRPALQKTNILVCVAPSELLFLPGDVSRHLDLHVRKMTLQRQWGLPKRVLQSLRWLFPGLGNDANKSETSGSHPEQFGRVSLGKTTSESLTVWERKGMTDGNQERDQLLSTVGSGMLNKLQIHWAKKGLEIQLQVFPTVATRSLQHSSHSSRRALPKLILAGQGTRQPRCDVLPFMGQQYVDRIELAVRCNHIISLWGLGMRYVEALAGIVPRSRPQFLKCQGSDVVFSKVETPFLQEQVRDALELHVKKKMIQHLWGTPRLVQRSLGAFTRLAPSRPPHKTSEIEVHPHLQEMLFLPLDTQSHLEHHVQRLKLQQRWGLPRRVLRSLKIFCPLASAAAASLSQSDEDEEPPAQMANSFSSVQKSALRSHLKKKRLEIPAEMSLGMITELQQKAGGMGRGHLPTLIHAGQKCPPSPQDSPPSAVSELERNAQHKYLPFVRGLGRKYQELGRKYQELGRKYQEPQLRMARPSHASPPTSQMAFHFQEIETPVLQEKAEQMLERHIQKKRLQHQWGLPSAITRSLQAFAPPPLTPPHSPSQRAGWEIRIQVEKPFFFTAHIWKDLEGSVKKMMIHQQWGLPKRIHNSLRAFSPATLADGDQQSCQEEKGVEKSVAENILTCGPGVEGAPNTSTPLQAAGAGLSSPKHFPFQSVVQSRTDLSGKSPKKESIGSGMPSATEEMTTTRPQVVKKDSIVSEMQPITEETSTTRPQVVKKDSIVSGMQPMTEETSTTRPQPITEETSTTRPQVVKKDSIVSGMQPMTEETSTTRPQVVKKDSIVSGMQPMTEETSTTRPQVMKKDSIVSGMQPITEETSTTRPQVVKKDSIVSEMQPITEETSTTRPQVMKKDRIVSGMQPMTEETSTTRPQVVKKDSIVSGMQPITEETSTTRPQVMKKDSIVSGMQPITEETSTTRPQVVRKDSIVSGMHPITEETSTTRPQVVKKDSIVSGMHPITEETSTTRPQVMKKDSIVSGMQPITEETSTTRPQVVRKDSIVSGMQPMTEETSTTRPQVVRKDSIVSGIPPATKEVVTTGPHDVMKESIGSEMPLATEEMTTTRPQVVKKDSIVLGMPPATEEMGSTMPQDGMKERIGFGMRPVTEDTSTTRPQDMKKDSMASTMQAGSVEMRTTKPQNVTKESIALAMQPVTEEMDVTEDVSVASGMPPAIEKRRSSAPHSLQMTAREALGATRERPQAGDEKSSDSESPVVQEEKAVAEEIPRKNPALYRTELWIKIGKGGKIGSSVATERSPCFLFPKVQPSVEIPEQGGGHKMKRDRRAHKFPCSEGNAWEDESTGRSSLHIPWPDLMPGPSRRIPGEPLESRRRPRSLPAAPLAKSPWVSSPKYDPIPCLRKRSFSDRSGAPAADASTGMLFWDEDKILHQLDHNLQGTARISRSEILPSICIPCRCHMETYSRDAASSYEMYAGQGCQLQDSTPPLATKAEASSSSEEEEEDDTQHSGLSPGESPTGVSLLCREVTQEHLLTPSELEVGHLLCTHVTQKALGPFVPHAYVICSHCKNKDMVTRQHGQKTREELRQVGGQFYKRKSHPDVFKETRRGLSSQECDVNIVHEKQRKPVGETEDRTRVSPREARPHPSTDSGQSSHRSGASADPQACEGLPSSEEDRESSGEDSEVSGESHLKQGAPGPSLSADDELPAPPSDWFRSDVEEEGAERESDGHPTSAGKGASWSSSERSPLPVEDLSQFSTEYEEEMVGDWDSDSIVRSSKALAEGEGRGDQDTASTAGTHWRPWCEGASHCKHVDQRVSIIASILEKKLWLQHGLCIWLGSQGGQRPGPGRQRSSLAGSSWGEGQFQKGPPAHAEPAVERAAVGRWGDPSSGFQQDGHAHRQSGRLVPGARQLEAGGRGSHLRPSTSTSPTSNLFSAEESSRLNHSQMRSRRPENKPLRDRSRRKPTSCAVREKERWKPHSSEKATETGAGMAGSRKWSAEVRATGSFKRSRPAVHREEGTSSGEETSPSLWQRFLTKEKGSRRKEKGSVVRVWFKEPSFSPVQEKKTKQENRVVLRSGHHQSTSRRSLHSGAITSSRQTKMGSGLVAQEASCAFCRGQHRADRESIPTTPLCKPKVTFYGELFHSLKEKILLRRRQLEDSSDSEEEKFA
uniref:Uncharacterized protein n=1 Tax=Sphaerodactylus townsendi TaxID=933632 RepID=A0ACB8ET90_9SAUR